jgi:hypothetical protein
MSLYILQQFQSSVTNCKDDFLIIRNAYIGCDYFQSTGFIRNYFFINSHVMLFTIKSLWVIENKYEVTVNVAALCCQKSLFKRSAMAEPAVPTGSFLQPQSSRKPSAILAREIPLSLPGNRIRAGNLSFGPLEQEIGYASLPATAVQNVEPQLTMK